MSLKKINIAIDGHSGCGKSTTAKAVAEVLNYTYIDTGAMYRAVTLYFLKNDVDINHVESVTNALQNIHIDFRDVERQSFRHLFLNNRDVEEEIRSLHVASHVSAVAAISSVRTALVRLQRQIGEKKGVVMDGRDIGTVVFPNAECKFFMTASIEVRTERRILEMKAKGEDVSFESVRENLQKRDEIDSNRADSPLKMAEDAILIDTTHLTFDEQVSLVLSHIQNKLKD